MSSVSVHRRVGAADGVHTHGGMPLAFGEEAPLQCAVPWVSLEGILLSDVAGHSVTKLPDATFLRCLKGHICRLRVQWWLPRA